MRGRRPSIDPPVAAIALVVLGVLLAFSAGYGYHRDELYFLEAGGHLAWGFVDQPPLTPALAAAADGLLGASPSALRVLPALATGALVLIAAALAREFGGGRFARLLAALATATVPVFLGAGHLLSTTPFDFLAWGLVLLIAVRVLNGADPRLWLLAGAVAGVGLLNKWNVAFLAAALVIGLLLTERRRELLSPWLWAGAALALAIWAPNLAWQFSNDWPSLEMLDALEEENAEDGARALFAPGQVLFAGLVLLPVWVAGLWWLLRDPAGRRHRAIAYAYLLLFGFYLVSAGQAYYLAGLYLPLIAAGAVVVERWLSRPQPGPLRRRRVVLAVVAIGAIPSLLIALPVLPEETLGDLPLQEINAELGETVGWPELADQVGAAYGALPARERGRAVVLTGNYGEAGAIDRFGPQRGLPRAFSGHNNYWWWGPPPGSRSSAVITVGLGLAYLGRFFERCEPAGRVRSPHGIDNDEDGATIAVCRGQQQRWERLWPRLQNYG